MTVTVPKRRVPQILSRVTPAARRIHVLKPCFLVSQVVVVTDATTSFWYLTCPPLFQMLALTQLIGRGISFFIKRVSWIALA